MTRRAFTVMETVMAAALGSAVVGIAVGFFQMIDRTERRTGEQEREAATLAQLHLVMDRTFGSLVMSESMPLSGPTVPARTRASADGGAAGAGASRPRLMLDQEPSLAPAPPRNEGPVQRLEIVLEKSPVPPGWGGGLMQDTSYIAEDPEIRASRGAFELRPGRGRNAAPDGTWSLWWRPLPPTADRAGAMAYALDPLEDERAVVVAEGLTECRWIAFKNRERGGDIHANRFDELPAYMEMKVRTASGLSAYWMFEVQWSNGPETQAEARAAEQAAAAAGGGPGATGATGSTGATGPQGPGVNPPAPGGVVPGQPVVPIGTPPARDDQGPKKGRQRGVTTDIQ